MKAIPRPHPEGATWEWKQKFGATAKNGDVWTGEEQEDENWWYYETQEGDIYESREAPVYRIVMDNAKFVGGKYGGIEPINPK